MRHTKAFRKKLDGLHVTSLFLGNNRQHRPVCAKTISSWVRKVLCVTKANMSPGFLQGSCSLSSCCFPGVPSCRQVTGKEFLHQLDTGFPCTLLLWMSTRILYSMLEGPQ